ncbi:hypothetical protein SGRIM128S_08418 [Streptomyces griseomycini]
MESADAGTASRFSSLAGAACVYCAIVSRVDARVVGEERRQSVAASSGGVRRGNGTRPVATAMARKSSAVGHRRPVEVAVGARPTVGGRPGLSTADAGFGDQPGVAGCPPGARDLRGAARRVGVLDAGRVRPR